MGQMSDLSHIVGLKPSWTSHLLTEQEQSEFQILETLNELADCPAEEIEAFIESQNIADFSLALQNRIYLCVFGLHAINEYGNVTQEIMQSRSYQAWHQQYAANSVLQHQNSSAEKLLSFCELENEAALLYRKGYYNYLLEQGDNEDSFEAFLSKYAHDLYKVQKSTFDEEIALLEPYEPERKLPAELREFFKTIGGLKGGSNAEGMLIYSAKGLIEEQQAKKYGSPLKSVGIVDMLNYVWGNDKEEFSPSGGAFNQQQINELNRRYTAIGYIHVDDNSHIIIYFDDNQQFGAVWYDQDNGEIFSSYLDLMLEKSIAQHSLWDLLSALIFMFSVPYLEHEALVEFCLDLRDV